MVIFGWFLVLVVLCPEQYHYQKIQKTKKKHAYGILHTILGKIDGLNVLWSASYIDIICSKTVWICWVFNWYIILVVCHVQSSITIKKSKNQYATYILHIICGKVGGLWKCWIGIYCRVALFRDRLGMVVLWVILVLVQKCNIPPKKNFQRFLSVWRSIIVTLRWPQILERNRKRSRRIQNRKQMYSKDFSKHNNNNSRVMCWEKYRQTQTNLSTLTYFGKDHRRSISQTDTNSIFSPFIDNTTTSKTKRNPY